MLVIIGPSACGKTQIVNKLISDFGYKKLKNKVSIITLLRKKNLKKK